MKIHPFIIFPALYPVVQPCRSKAEKTAWTHTIHSHLHPGTFLILLSTVGGNLERTREVLWGDGAAHQVTVLHLYTIYSEMLCFSFRSWKTKMKTMHKEAVFRIFCSFFFHLSETYPLVTQLWESKPPADRALYHQNWWAIGKVSSRRVWVVWHLWFIASNQDHMQRTNTPLCKWRECGLSPE